MPQIAEPVLEEEPQGELATVHYNVWDDTQRHFLRRHPSA